MQSPIVGHSASANWVAYVSFAQPMSLFVERIWLHDHFLQLVGGVTVDAVLLETFQEALVLE